MLEMTNSLWPVIYLKPLTIFVETFNHRCLIRPQTRLGSFPKFFEKEYLTLFELYTTNIMNQI